MCGCSGPALPLRPVSWGGMVCVCRDIPTGVSVAAGDDSDSPVSSTVPGHHQVLHLAAEGPMRPTGRWGREEAGQAAASVVSGVCAPQHPQPRASERAPLLPGSPPDVGVAQSVLQPV